MIATTFEIVYKPTETPLDLANIGYFQLRESGHLPAVGRQMVTRLRPASFAP